MIGSEIIEFFHKLIDDDELDPDFEYNLATAAKDEVEAEREWEFLKKKDSSKTTTASGIELPDDFLTPLCLFVGGETQPHAHIPFEQQTIFNSNGRAFYIDYSNETYYFTNQNIVQGRRIDFFYCRQTDDIAADDAPAWPSKFHKIIAFKMAEMFYPADQGNKIDTSYNWSPYWQKQYTILKSLMVDWDERMKKRSRENGLNLADMTAGLSYDGNGFYIGDM